MPLPPNGVLSLQGHVGPGITDSSKPKQAMIVRMSAETFEALEAQANPPKVEVEFGASPGLYVGDKFFPMRPHTENSPHELYIRSVPANKTTAPLKLYANVIGKFMVERELGSKVESSVRDKTTAAEKQRTERKTILLDAPPPSAPPVKASKKKNSTIKKLATAASNRPSSASSSAQASRIASPRPTPAQTRESQPQRPSPRPPASTTTSESDRARLIHFLALNPRTLMEVMKSVGGIAEDQPYRQDLIDLLKLVAQAAAKPTANGTPGPQKWLLKPRTWLEVKPFTYPNLSDRERRRLSEKAVSVFEGMGIPESDPRWDDIRRPPGMGGNASKAGASTSTVGSRRPATVHDAKSKPTTAESSSKSKAAASESSAKSERLKVPKYEDDDDSQSVTNSSKAPARRLPGSGFKMKSGSDTPPTPDPPSSRSESKKAVDIRSIKIEKSSHQSSSLPPPPPRDARPSINSNASTTRVPQSSRDAHEFARPADPVRERARDSPGPGSSLKRKKTLRDDPDTDFSERESVNGSTKKRRMEETVPDRRKDRDLSLPKKPIVRDPSPPALRHKISKYDGRSPLLPPSPLPPPSPRLPPKQTRHERAPSFASNRSRDDSSHRSSSARPRRKSPIYTSSEDEEEQPRRKNDGARRDKERDRERERERERDRDRDRDRDEKAPPSSAPASTTHFQKHAPAPIPPTPTPLTLPDSPEVLKKIYARRWLIYSSLRARHAALVDEIHELLRSGSGSGGDEDQHEAEDLEDVYLPEGDPGLPHPEEMVRLREELDREERALRAIVEKWEGLRRVGRTDEGPLVPKPEV